METNNEFVYEILGGKLTFTVLYSDNYNETFENFNKLVLEDKIFDKEWKIIVSHENDLINNSLIYYLDQTFPEKFALNMTFEYQGKTWDAFIENSYDNDDEYYTQFVDDGIMIHVSNFEFNFEFFDILKKILGFKVKNEKNFIKKLIRKKENLEEEKEDKLHRLNRIEERLKDIDSYLKKITQNEI